MSKKTLLNEATVRRFMKLASVGKLADTFINEGGYGMGYDRDEDEDPVNEMGHDTHGAGERDEEELDAPEDEVGLPEEEPVEDEAPEAPEDMGPEPEADADEVEITEDDRDVLAQAAEILSRIAGGDAGGMDEPAMDEPVMDEPVMEGKDLSTMGANKDKSAVKTDANIVPEQGQLKEEEEAEDAPPLDEVDVIDEEELVKEVSRRVAARIKEVLNK